jgi:hypothetical protein
VFSSTSQNGAETFRFRNLEAITDKEVEKLLLEMYIVPLPHIP